MFARLMRGPWPHLPSRCAVCHAWPSEPVCEVCVQRFAQPIERCITCALPVHGGATQCGQCVRTPPPLDACVAAVPYAYPWADLIAAFKFQDQCGWASNFAALMRSAPWVEPALEQADVLIPMPLSRERLRQRGYNQALELARHLARGKTEARWLLRLRDTPAQASLEREQRFRNMREAFALEPLRPGCVQGLRVVLVDDVMTSGASLFAAATALRAGGARHITGMVFARTE